MNQQRDAVVIGGGPAGASAGLLLARSGWSVTIIEKKSFPRRKVCGEYLSATTLPLLEQFGLRDRFETLAGPPVTHVGLFAGQDILTADLPTVTGEWGRALGRESLDSMLLNAATNAGAEVLQPDTVERIDRNDGRFEIHTAETMRRTRVVIAAHGSWDAGTLPTQPGRRPMQPGDLLGFKGHFTQSQLPVGLMPLLAFPGGYGGMTHVDDGRVSLSCCIRRDQLAKCRHSYGGDAGESVLAHLKATCRGVRETLDRANKAGAWLAAGPIRPGIRVDSPDGVFRIGNAAGEAHPVVAEGVSMAMQSAWLLASHLNNGTANAYPAGWRRAFASRLAASRVIAHWAMRPWAVKLTMPLLRRFPSLLTRGARASGKATRVVQPAFDLGMETS